MNKAVPQEFSPITAHLVVPSADEAIEFYRKAFDANELRRETGPDGRIWICELLINRTRVLLHEEFPDMGLQAPVKLGGVSVQLHMYVPNADASYAKAIEAGATSVMEPMDAFWGERYSQVQDPAGHRWVLATQLEDLSPDQLHERAKEYKSEHAGMSQPAKVTKEAAFKAD
ncbi:VOC family protein [Amycolatopsis speibonae]|uniref:VOC family protein n=1 Tax=Amycolatopsis speibonae TaxID=1450224 RepID=A0ABV7NSE9_9PSEU